MNAIQTNPTAQLLATLQALATEHGKLRLLASLPAALLPKRPAAKPPNARPPDARHLPAHLQRDIGLIDGLPIRRKD